MNTLPTGSPCVQSADLDLVRATLAGLGYHATATEAILAHIFIEGTVEGCPWLDQEDYVALEEALELGFPTEPWTSPAWDEHATEPDRAPFYDTTQVEYLLDLWEWAHNLAMGSAGPESPPEVPDDPFPADDFPAQWEPPDAPDGRWHRMMSEAWMPPVTGGAPTAYVPTAEDLADYAEWSERLDRIDDLMREEEMRNPLYGYE